MPSIAKIFGGALFAYAPNGNDFAFETDEFSVHFQLGHTGGIHLPLSPQTGTSIDCSAILAGQQSLRLGWTDFAGHVAQQLWFDGTIDIKAGSVMVPSLPAQPIRLMAPFKISGTLRAFPSDPSVSPPPPATFNYQLAGAGDVTVRLTSPIGAFRNVTSYFYKFT